MAPVIWGLDLGEITWSKFGSKNMWNNKYHLRRSKIIFYQLAMIFCVVSESLGTAALSDYVEQQGDIKRLDSRALEHNNDYVGAASYNIFSGVFLAFIFGAAFFFDLIWPERHEDHGIRWAWKICAIMAAVFQVASAFTLTIITATRSAHITGVSSDEAARLLDMVGKGPLEYKHKNRAIAAVVFVWPGAIFTVISAVVLWMSHMHDDKYGDPFSTHYREEIKGRRQSVDRETDFINQTEPNVVSADAEKGVVGSKGTVGTSTPNTLAAGDVSNEKISQDAPRISEPATVHPGPAHGQSTLFA